MNKRSRFSPPRTLVLGTGTEIGKTYVTCLLAEAWNQANGTTLAVKPVESGVRGVAEDAARLSQVATMGDVPCCALPEPISPHLAARKVGVSIELEDLVEFVQVAEGRLEGFAQPLSIVETAGGVFSPLSDTTTNFDLARALDPAVWVLVCPNALGVLHDVQAALRAMVHRLPDLLVFSESRAPDASTLSNVQECLGVVLPQVRLALDIPQYHPSVLSIPAGATAASVGPQVLDALRRALG